MSGGLTISRALADGARALDRAGIPEARREVRLLIGHVLGAAGGVFDRAFHGDGGRLLVDDEAAQVKGLVQRRAARRPMAQVLGHREFWSLPFRVTEDTLDPRPDSETLIAAVLEAHPCHAAPLHVLDMGVGTGCLLLAVLSEFPAATGLGVDFSTAACRVAHDNARALGLDGRADFITGDWGRGLAGRFDIILANPPYIAEGDFAALAPEVARFEPRLALDGGVDGLACYRALMADAARLLAPWGKLFLEVGAGQAPDVTRICADHGLAVLARAHDLSAIERCLIAEGVETP